MTVSIAIRRREDGSILEGVSDGWDINEPCVSIPVSVIKSHDDDTIVAWVRDACEYAEKAAALSYSEWLLRAYIDDHIFQSDATSIFLLQRFAGTDERIDAALFRLEQLRERTQFRTTVKGRRRELASNYDLTFLELGRRDGFHCQHCHATKGLTIDHITPLIRGGTNDPDNLQLLCKTCNSRKGDK